MGGNESKGQVLSNAAPVQAVVAVPEPHYPGPAAQYNFINTDVIIGTQLAFNFLQSPMVTTNIDNYYPTLASQYAQGYRLLSFYRIPGQRQQQGLFSTSVALGFQGIFCRYPTAPRRENWQLRVEKSTIQLSRMFSGIITINTGVTSDTTHVMDSIAQNTQGGGRLICVELTGQQSSASRGLAMQGFLPSMGVDLFFEVPETPMAQQYVYSCVSVPITLTMKLGFKLSPTVHCDWIGTLGGQLNQGWRLIEIFMDKAMHTRARSCKGETTMNSMWFFEKPASRMDDPTPIYQGTVLDHQIKLQTTFGGAKTTTNWEPVIQEMGNKGWELACILETLETQPAGFASVYMTCKLFFQRPILAQSGAGPMPMGLPPPYDMAVGGMGPVAGPGWAVGGMGPVAGQGQGQGDAPPPAAEFKPPPPPGDMGY